MNDEEAMFEVWWALYRSKRWKEARPDSGDTPSIHYMEGFKSSAKLGWMARSGTHVTYSRSAVGKSDAR